jgi:hypothetical protein
MSVSDGFAICERLPVCCMKVAGKRRNRWIIHASVWVSDDRIRSRVSPSSIKQLSACCSLAT